MTMQKLRAPVTVFHNGQYLPPGTVIEVTEEEAKRLAAVHGEYEGKAFDPANTKASAADEASIATLNEHASIHGGHGAGHRPKMARS